MPIVFIIIIIIIINNIIIIIIISIINGFSLKFALLALCSFFVNFETAKNDRGQLRFWRFLDRLNPHDEIYLLRHTLFFTIIFRTLFFVCGGGPWASFQSFRFVIQIKRKLKRKRMRQRKRENLRGGARSAPRRSLHPFRFRIRFRSISV